MKRYFVYILASKPNGTLYTGITSNLERRMYEHKNGLLEGFTKQHSVHMLVYYEKTTSVDAAIEREKQIKNWRRKWKTDLINDVNPNWNDLSIGF